MQAEFAKRLRSERERLKLSQQHCADAAGVSLSAYKGWEKDRSMPADKLAALGRIGFDVHYVVSVEVGGELAGSDSDPHPEAVWRLRIDTAAPAGLGPLKTVMELTADSGRFRAEGVDRNGRPISVPISDETLERLFPEALSVYREWTIKRIGSTSAATATAGRQSVVAERVEGYEAGAALDLAVLAECMEALEEVKPGLSPARKAKAVAALYELVKHSPVKPQRATLLQFIRNAA